MRRILKYAPFLNRITGTIEGTLLLLQLFYWFCISKFHPFYKYQSPNKFCRTGDSLTEELGITVHALKKALKKIGSFINHKKDYQLIELNIIIYWKEYPNRTFYFLNYVAMLSIEKEGTFFCELFPHYRTWKHKVISADIELSQFMFSPSQRAIYPLSYIQEMNTKDEPTNESKDENIKTSISDFIVNKTTIFKKAWSNWKIYSSEKHQKNYSQKEELTLLKSTENLDEDFVVLAIEEAIVKGWKSFIFKNSLEQNAEFLKARKPGGYNKPTGYSSNEIFESND